MSQRLLLGGGGVREGDGEAVIQRSGRPNTWTWRAAILDQFGGMFRGFPEFENKLQGEDKMDSPKRLC